MRLYRAVILMAGQALNEPHERIPGDDAHDCILACSQNGHKEGQRAAKVDPWWPCGTSEV